MSRTSFLGAEDIRAIEVRLYLRWYYSQSYCPETWLTSQLFSECQAKQKLDLCLTLAMLNKVSCHANFKLPIILFNPDCWYKFTYLMTNCADPVQLASEANWSGSTLFAKAGRVLVQQDQGYSFATCNSRKWTQVQEIYVHKVISFIKPFVKFNRSKCGNCVIHKTLMRFCLFCFISMPDLHYVQCSKDRRPNELRETNLIEVSFTGV